MIVLGIQWLKHKQILEHGWYDIEIVFPMVAVPDQSPVLALRWIQMVPVGRLDGSLQRNIRYSPFPLRYTDATPSITSAADVAGAVGKPFSYRILASSNPTSFGASGLPSWVSMDTTGELPVRLPPPVHLL